MGNIFARICNSSDFINRNRHTQLEQCDLLNITVLVNAAWELLLDRSATARRIRQSVQVFKNGAPKKRCFRHAFEKVFQIAVLRRLNAVEVPPN